MSTGTITLNHSPHNPQTTATIPVVGATLQTGISSTHPGNAVSVAQEGVFIKNDRIHITGQAHSFDHRELNVSSGNYDYYAFAFREGDHLKINYSQVKKSTGEWSSIARAYVGNFFQGKGQDSVSDAIDEGYLVESDLMVNDTPNFFNQMMTDAYAGGAAYLPASMDYVEPPVPGVDFVLSALNSDMMTSIFQLVAVGKEEDILEYAHEVTNNVKVPAAEWNQLFYLSPDSDISDRDGLDNATALYDIDVFEAERMHFKTNADALTNAALPFNKTGEKLVTLDSGSLTTKHANLTAGGPDATGATNVMEACIRTWSRDIYKQENMSESTWTNRLVISNEIRDLLQSVGFDGDDSKGLLGQLKLKIADADDKTQNVGANDDTTKANMTRQLLLQLHTAATTAAQNNGDSNGDLEARLLNTDAATSIFHTASTTITDGENDDSGNPRKYYPFKFVAGDTLSFVMTIKHPNTYGAAIDGSGVSDGSAGQTPTTVFSGSDAPTDMVFKVTLEME